MKRKIAWLILSCLMVLSLVLASCGPTEPEEEEEVIIPEEEEEEEEEEEVIVPEEEGPKYGGTLTIVQQQTLSNPNPKQAGPAIQTPNSHTHERLGICDWAKGPAGTGEFAYTSSSYYYPDWIGNLAESWEHPDPYTFILHVRQGVHFHNKPPVNGREFTADDIVYSIKYEFAHPEFHMDLNPSQTESITALDKYTVEIKSNTLDYRFLETYMIGIDAWMIPPEPNETYGEGFTNIEGNCGTGPFIMTDFVSNSVVTLDRNPDYWAYDEVNPENQLPYVDRVKILMITDKSTYLSALRTGKIDYITAIEINDAESLMETSPELEYKPFLNNFFKRLIMRQDKEELPFSDIRVRKAMAMAIDRDTIIRDYLHGMGEKLSDPIHPLNNPDAFIPLDELPESIQENFEYNPERAKQLLTDAGYPNGFQTKCITVESVVEQLQILVAYWKAIGVDVEIQVVDQVAFMNLTMGKKYEEMAYSQIGSSNPIYDLETRVSDEFMNVDRHIDPEYDAKYYELLEITDVAEQNERIQELSIMLLDSVMNVQFPAEYQYNFWWPWLKSYHGESSLGPVSGVGALNARIWIDQELKKEMGY